LKQTPFNEFISGMQARTWPQNVKIESTGYITVIDMEKADEV